MNNNDEYWKEHSNQFEDHISVEQMKPPLVKKLHFTCLRSDLTSKCVAAAKEKFGINSVSQKDYEIIVFKFNSEIDESIEKIKAFFIEWHCAVGKWA